MIRSLIGAIIFLAIGIFAGIILCVELGIYDAYKTDLLESELGVPFYTEKECRAFIDDGLLVKENESPTLKENDNPENTDNSKTLSLRERLKEKMENGK